MKFGGTKMKLAEIEELISLEVRHFTDIVNRYYSSTPEDVKKSMILEYDTEMYKELSHVEDDVNVEHILSMKREILMDEIFDQYRMSFSMSFEEFCELFKEVLPVDNAGDRKLIDYVTDKEKVNLENAYEKMQNPYNNSYASYEKVACVIAVDLLQDGKLDEYKSNFNQ